MRLPSIALLLSLAACQTKPTPDPAPAPSAPGVASTPVAVEAPVEAGAPKPAASALPAAAAELAKGGNALGYDLFRRAPAGELAISPASIGIALAMAELGAKNATAAQMKARLPGAPEEWGALAGALQGEDLRIANRIFLEKTYRFEPPFLEKTASAFGAPAEGVDFASAPQPSRVHINDWVAGQTQQRIKDLIPADGVTSDTRFALVNAIYFLGTWKTPFVKELTENADFAAPGGTRKVPTMQLSRRLRSGAAEGARFVELPYADDRLAMTVIVPERIADLEKALSTDVVARIDLALKSQTTRVLLPRFEIDPASSLSLGDALVALGMKDAFDREKADFTAMANPPKPADRLYVSKVFHKAFVKVDEKGTEAAAATAVIGAKGGGAPAPPFEVRADRPFVFLIRERTTGLVLFLGRVLDPKG